MTNTLHYGDNLSVLRDEVGDATVDLIYLDPPFNSNANYNILFKSPEGHDSDAQIVAFEDTWHWNEAAEDAYGEVRKSGNTAAFELLSAMRRFLGENDMMAYLAMMAVRLLELHRVLKPTGSLYLHCDPTASHYLKLLLDAVFGPTNFRSEIVWRRSGSHNSATRQYGPVHDVILFYAKTDQFRLNPVLYPHSKGYIEGEFRYSDKRGQYRLNEIMGPGSRKGESGKAWRGYDPTPKGRHWAIPESLRSLLPNRGEGTSLQEQLDALDELGEIQFSSTGRPKYKQRPTGGVALQDVWAFQPGTEGCLYQDKNAIDSDVRWLSNEAEKLGYPTQKPLGLLERIIAASSDEGDVVLDPFCGCGTAVHAAQKLGRRWIGIDVTHLAVKLIEDRMHDAFPGLDFAVKGRPESLDAALDLARRDKNEFEKWAVTAIDGTPFRTGKGADGGVDGLIYFNGWDSVKEKLTDEKAIISVKGGSNVKVTWVGELLEPVERNEAAVGILLMAGNPTREMEKRAAAAGTYDLGEHGRFPRIQIITLAEYWHKGTRPRLPNIDRSTMKKAKREAGRQDRLI